MPSLAMLRLKKNQDRRVKTGHIWIYSNEIDTKVSPLKSFTPGQEVLIEAHDKTILGVAYVNPHSLISARLISRDQQDRLDVNFLSKKIKLALDLRLRLFPKPFYRLLFGESDGVPGLVVDRFDKILVAQLNTAGIDAKKDFVIAALLAVLPDTEAILFRNDSSARLSEGLEKNIIAGYGTPPEKILIEENGVSFYVPLWVGQKTGWFYDHRLNRARLTDYVANKRVLDVFSYLGAWGIQAVVSGASEAVCIDASSLATSWITENAELNQVGNQVRVLCDDAFDALKKLHLGKEKFDVIILDPPAFAKKQKDIKEGLLAYQRINELALKLLVPDGILISCSCSMHVSEEDLIQAIRRANYRAHSEMQILERGHQGPDHPIHVAIPETNYLKMVMGRKLP